MARHWTEDTDRAADVLFATLPTSEIRDRQDIANAEIIIAYSRGDTDVLADCQAKADALTRAMLARTPEWDDKRPAKK
jgi:hypothetical protein